MSGLLTIALDAMGGDHGPHVVVPAALNVLAEQLELKLILVGNRELIAAELRARKADVGERLTIQHSSQSVEMDELPSQALRNKKDSSMRVAINLVKEGVASACVSAGNTGALMATARYVLKTLPGVDRPAIISSLPTLHGHTHMLDLGANIECSAEQLFQFAVMGSVLVSAVDSIARPRVGLLNIGEEEMKGNEQVKEAARLLSESDINYIGFVEGNDIYTGVADVVVCDGFTGNVALKASEGVARMISHYMKQAFHRNIFTKLAGLITLPVFKDLKKKIDPRRYNGASLVGLQGIVIKSHGGADVFAFANAIKEAVLEVKKDVPQRIGEQLRQRLSERQAL
ncbi:MAG: phosphate acyltransferase PlsX [Gammaproteobacteria bacterium]